VTGARDTRIPGGPALVSRVLMRSSARPGPQSAAWAAEDRHARERAMKPNIGKAERAARVVIGIAVLSLAFVGPQTPWAYLGLLPFVTGLVGWCPPYALLGVSTVRSSK